MILANNIKLLTGVHQPFGGASQTSVGGFFSMGSCHYKQNSKHHYFETPLGITFVNKCLDIKHKMPINAYQSLISTGFSWLQNIERENVTSQLKISHFQNQC